MVPEHSEARSGSEFGRPCIRGMRISVYDIPGWLAAGMANGQIVGEFPELTLGDIRAAPACAADLEAFLRVLVKMPDTEPEERDRIETPLTLNGAPSAAQSLLLSERLSETTVRP